MPAKDFVLADAATRNSHTRHRASVRSGSGNVAPVRVVAPGELDAEFIDDLVAEAKSSQTRLGRIRLRLVGMGPQFRRGSFMVVLLSLIAGFGFVSTGDTAQAMPWDDMINKWCEFRRINVDTDDPHGHLVPFGAPYGVTEDDATGLERPNNESGKWAETTWAQRGISGIKWKPFWLLCGEWGNWIFNGMADMALTIPVYITGALITFFQWTFQGTIVNIFVDPQTTGGVSALDNMVRALKLGLFANLAALAIVIAALMLAYRALIKQTGLADFASKLLIMTLIAGFIAWFTPNASWAVRSMNDVTNSITGDVFAAFSKAICAVGPAGVTDDADLNSCDLQAVDDDDIFQTNQPPDTSDGVACYDSSGVVLKGVEPVDCIGQVLYHSLIFTPWATGLLGPLEAQATVNGQKLSADQFQQNYEARLRLAYATLAWQGYSRAQIEKLEQEKLPIHGVIGKPKDSWVQQSIDEYQDFLGWLKGPGADYLRKNYPWGAAEVVEVVATVQQVTTAILEGAYKVLSAVGDFLFGSDPEPTIIAAHPNAVAFSMLMKEFANEDRMKDVFSKDYDHGEALPDMFQIAQGDNANDSKSYSKLEHAVKDEHRTSFSYFTGRHPEHRFMTVLLMFVAMIAFGGVLISVSMAYLVLQLMCVILTVLAPLVMLVGLIPEIGTRIFLQAANLWFGTYLKRIGLGIGVGLLMTLYAAILSMPFQWYAQLALLVGIAMAGVAFRKKLMEMAGLGGVDAASMKMAGGAARAPFKAAGMTGKGLMATQRAGRLFASGMRNNLKRTKNMRDKDGKRVGGLRRGAMAMWAGGKGAAGGMQVDGTMFDKQQRARAISGQHTRNKIDKRGYKPLPASATQTRATRSTAAYEQYVDEQVNVRQGRRRTRVERQRDTEVRRAARKQRLERVVDDVTNDVTYVQTPTRRQRRRGSGGRQL
ncbi:MAG: hypothetical protein HOQ05_00815 [Corynebacteriales bacterium]|nr:hypothetical protein [Mycobacteriales bacterium]